MKKIIFILLIIQQLVNADKNEYSYKDVYVQHSIHTMYKTAKKASDKEVSEELFSVLAYLMYASWLESNHDLLISNKIESMIKRTYEDSKKEGNLLMLKLKDPYFSLHNCDNKSMKFKQSMFEGTYIQPLALAKISTYDDYIKSVDNFILYLEGKDDKEDSNENRTRK